MGKDLKGQDLGAGLCQRKGGMYCARFTNRFGKRCSIYSTDLKALKKELKEETRKDISRTNVNVQYTLNAWYQKWMEIYKYQIRENSKRHYSQVYIKHIGPVLGDKLLTAVTNLDVRALINDLDSRGYQYETKNKVRVILLDMFDKAMIDDFVLKNPVRSVKVERPEVIERRVLSIDEQADFFDTCRGTFYEELFTVAVLTGLRPGELCALRWKDVDISHHTLTVSRTLLYQKLAGDAQKELHIDPPKTKTSARTVTFNERCAAALRSQFRKKSIVSLRESAKPLMGFEDLLFVTKFDTPINAQIYSDAIKRVVELVNENKSDIEQFARFSGHTFRHTYATRCFEAGVDAKVVQKQLGHASLKMTMDLYTHLLEEKKLEELDKFSRFSEGVFESVELLKERRYADLAHPKVVCL